MLIMEGAGITRSVALLAELLKVKII